MTKLPPPSERPTPPSESERPIPPLRHRTGFAFNPGDRIVARGMTHWSNTVPLRVVSVSVDNFVGVTEDGTEFEYAKGTSDSPLFWIPANIPGWVRDLAVEIADYIDTPDFTSNPDRNAHTIDMVEEILLRRLTWNGALT
jgi:hypothetical protein